MISKAKLEKIIREFVMKNGMVYPPSRSGLHSVKFHHEGVLINVTPTGYRAFVKTSDRKRPIYDFTSKSLGFRGAHYE